MASESEAPQASLVNKLYNKLNEKLKDALALFKDEWGTNFSTTTTKIQRTDVRLQLNARQHLDARVSTVNQRSSATINHTSTVAGPSSQTCLTNGLYNYRATTIAPNRQPTPGPSVNPRRAPTATPPPQATPGLAYPPNTRSLTCYHCGEAGHTRLACPNLHKPTIQNLEGDRVESYDQVLDTETINDVDDVEYDSGKEQP